MMKKKMIIQKQELVDAYVLDLRGNLEGDQGKHTFKKKIQEQVDDYVLNLPFWTYAGIWEGC